MLRKVIVTTVIAAGIFAAFLWLKTSGYLSFLV
jgi:hypothetical protein